MRVRRGGVSWDGVALVSAGAGFWLMMAGSPLAFVAMALFLVAIVKR